MSSDREIRWNLSEFGSLVREIRRGLPFIPFILHLSSTSVRSRASEPFLHLHFTLRLSSTSVRSRASEPFLHPHQKPTTNAPLPPPYAALRRLSPEPLLSRSWNFVDDPFPVILSGITSVALRCELKNSLQFMLVLLASNLALILTSI